MILVCRECGCKDDYETSSLDDVFPVCSTCGSTEMMSLDEKGKAGLLLKVSSTLYAEYSTICHKMGLNPEPGVNFESDDDLSMNIQILKERSSQIGGSDAV